MKILFWGTPEFAVPSLRALSEEGHDIVGVVTQPDRPEFSASPSRAIRLGEAENSGRRRSRQRLSTRASESWSPSPHAVTTLSRRSRVSGPTCPWSWRTARSCRGKSWTFPRSAR